MLSIGEWALPAEGVIEARLASAGAAGFDAVELVWCDEGSILSASPPAVVGTRARDAGVTISGLCTEPVTVGAGGGTRADGLVAMVEAATEMGLALVVVNLGRLAEDEARRTLDEVRRAGDRAGVAIALENGLPGDIVDHPRALDRLDPPDLPPVSVHLDVGNATATATLEDWLAPTRRPLRSLHLKDWSTEARAPRACGRGDVDWEWLWRALQGRTPPVVTVEHSRRALGAAALRDGLADDIRAWLRSGTLRGAEP